SRAASNWRVDSGKSIATKRRLGIKEENVQRSTPNVQRSMKSERDRPIVATTTGFSLRCFSLSRDQPSASAISVSGGALQRQPAIHCRSRRPLQEGTD